MNEVVIDFALARDLVVADYVCADRDPAIAEADHIIPNRRVNDVVHHIGDRPRSAHLELRTTEFAECEKVVVDRDIAALGQQHVTSAVLLSWPTVQKRLGDEPPLEGEVGRILGVDGLVRSPARRYVVDDDISCILAVEAERARAAGLDLVRSWPKAHVPHNHVMSEYLERRTRLQRPVADRDAFAWRRLPGDREVGVANHERRFLQRDRAAETKNARARTCRIDTGAKRSRATLGSAGDEDDLSSAPTLCGRAKALSGRERALAAVRQLRNDTRVPTEVTRIVHQKVVYLRARKGQQVKRMENEQEHRKPGSQDQILEVGRSAAAGHDALPVATALSPTINRSTSDPSPTRARTSNFPSVRSSNKVPSCFDPLDLRTSKRVPGPRQ